MYKIIELEQGTPEWHRFRSSHLGASDAPIICGASPWTSRLELYLMKTGFLNAPPMTAKMQRGHDLEPEARHLLIEQTNTVYSPVVLESLEYPFISCSLDGISNDRVSICEIKCPNAKTHQDAIEGFCPEYYYIQMQHALMVTGAAYCWYFSYRPEHKTQKTAMVKIMPHVEMMKNLLEEEIDFWHRVINLEEPQR